MSETKAEGCPWGDDVLVRKPYAKFLKSVILKKCKNPKDQEPRCCVLAIDDEWGTGKTCFVQAWRQDLENQNFYTLYFDAWANDCMGDPLLALMADLQKALMEFLPKGENVATATKNTARSIFKKATKAFVPVGKALALGYLKQKFGPDILTQPGLSDSDSDELATKGMEALLEHMLQEQGQQRQTIAEFKSEVGNIIQDIQGGNKQPILVFIDELDRCRPNFAVELLEGIKHLFDIPGLCFVISTNTKQLAETVKGAYGGNFDGMRYLDRFFDARFALPKPTTDQYCQLLATNHDLGSDGKSELLQRIDWGLPYEHDFHPNSEYQANAGSVFSWVAKVFDLDLRTQEQVFNRMMDASDWLPEGYRLQFLFMAVLATLAHVAPEIFDDLEGFKESSGWNKDFENKIRAKFIRNERISTQRILDGIKIQKIDFSHGLFDAFSVYAQEIHNTPKNLFEAYNQTKRDGNNAIIPKYYPETNLAFIMEEYPFKPTINSPASPDQLSLKLYFPLLRHAGFLHQPPKLNPEN